MASRRALRRLALLLGCAVAAGASCRGPVNLQEALAVTDVLSGWYDNGMKDGKNHLVPSITFRLKNQLDQPLSSVQLTMDFWLEGADGPLDSALVRGIGSESVAPGASTEPITVRSGTGYTLEAPRADLFAHSQFKDATVKIFAKRSGSIAPLGEFKIDRRLLPHVPSSHRP
jgi:hypothetical protein